MGQAATLSEAEAKEQKEQFPITRPITSAPWIATQERRPDGPQPFILESISPISWFNFVSRPLVIKDNMFI